MREICLQRRCEDANISEDTTDLRCGFLEELLDKAVDFLSGTQNNTLLILVRLSLRATAFIRNPLFCRAENSDPLHNGNELDI